MAEPTDAEPSASAPASPRSGWRDLVRVWSSAADAGRKRRPTDLLLLLGAIIVLAGLTLVAPGPTNLDTALAAALDALPSAVDLLWGVGYTALTLWALIVLVLPLAFRRRRGLSGILLLSGLIAVAGSLAVGVLAGTSAQDSLSALFGVPDSPVYVPTRVAVATAILVTASPHLSRPLRYWGRILITLGVVSAVALSTAWPIGAIAGLVMGLGAAAVTHLIFGSPQGLLTADQIEIALGDLGIEADEALPIPDEVSGEALWSVTCDDGRSLLVKVYGRDARDSQAVSSVWTALVRRGEMPHLGHSREYRAEHEALALVLAQRAGASVLELVTVGRTQQGDVVLATQSPRTTLAEMSGDEITDEVLDSWWGSVGRLHAAGLAHGRIDSRHLVLAPDGTPALADFADAVLNADERDRELDAVRLLVATSVAAGPDRALDSAVRVIGVDGLVQLMPYLQPAALGRHTKQGLDQAEWSLTDLKKAAIERLGIEPPPLLQMNRVTVKSVALVLVIAIIAYTMIGLFSGVDFSSVVDALSTANFAILLGALLLSPFVQTSFAVSTLGSTLVKLTYVPVLMLQYAIQFIALCLPSTAARIALEVRFFQKFGVPAASAVGMGMIDSFSGFIVQIGLIIVILVSGLPGFTSSVLGSSDSTSSTSTDSGPSTIAIVIAIAVIGLIVTLVVPRLRRRLLGNVGRLKASIAEQRRNAGEALAVLRHPRKLGTMLVGNLGAQVIQAVILGVCLAAFGESAALSQLILINTAVSLFAGLMPVPGGMGVAEAGYTAGLQAIGIPAPIAVSTAIAFRLVTFYLPPLWGSVAMRWLRRRQFI